MIRRIMIAIGVLLAAFGIFLLVNQETVYIPIWYTGAITMLFGALFIMIELSEDDEKHNKGE